MHIRFEHPDDIDKIRNLHLQAFDTDAEANLVDALRNAGLKLISLIAEENNQVIGHILFSPVTIDSNNTIKIMGLAPMAVLPNWQRKGIGTQLIKEGILTCQDADYHAIVVLGHPDYYPRFGFEPSINYGINLEFDVPADVFMLRELTENAVHGVTGSIKYHPLFNNL